MKFQPVIILGDTIEWICRIGAAATAPSRQVEVPIWSVDKQVAEMGNVVCL